MVNNSDIKGSFLRKKSSELCEVEERENGKSRGESPARLLCSPVALWFGLERKSDKEKKRGFF